jgi:hypothetical protein
MELLRSVSEFFHDEVRDAMRECHVEANESTEFYLVNLLVELTTTPPPVDEAPLAVKLAEAQAAPPEGRLRTLREVGDTSLVMSGFFAEALTRKLVDVEYYISMGGRAYRQASTMPTAGAHRDVFGELGGKLPEFVEVLEAIRSRTDIAGSGNVLRMFEEWQRTGSEFLEKKLRASGVLIGGGRGVLH